MIVLILIIAVMVGVVATYAIEARRERRHRRLAETAPGVTRGLTVVDGTGSSIAAEGILRGTSLPTDPGVGSSS